MKSMRDRSFLSSAAFAARQGTRVSLVISVFVLTVGASVADLNTAGKAAYARGDFAEAERLFSQAIAQAPDEPLVRYHRAVALMRLRRWCEATEAYQAVLRLDPPPALAAAARDGLQTLEPVTRPPARHPPPYGEARIPLRQARGGWSAEVVLNTMQKARFLVDTGASVCVISPELANVMGIKPRRDARSIKLQTISGSTEGLLVTIPSIRVGQAEAKKVYAVIHEIGPGVDGILGNTFLSHYEVTLDPKQGILHLRPR